MRVGSRGEFLKQITLIERAWEDVVQGLSNREFKIRRLRTTATA